MEKVSIRFYNDHEVVSVTTQLKLLAVDGKRYNNWNPTQEYVSIVSHIANLWEDARKPTDCWTK